MDEGITLLNLDSASILADSSLCTRGLRAVNWRLAPLNR